MLCRNCGRGQYSDIPNVKLGGEREYLPLPPTNPKFHRALQLMQEIHDKKSADYATTANRYSNFEEAAATAGVTVDEVFGVLIGVKLARLRELLGSGKKPNNESIADTKLDLANYAALWFSYDLEVK